LNSNWNLSFLTSKGQKHASTYIVLYLMKTLLGKGHRDTFRAFLQKHGEKPFPFIRVCETRFSTIEVLSRLVFQYFPYIYFYLSQSYPILSGQERKAFAGLRHPDVLAVIKLRALKAQFFDLLFMNETKHISTFQQYSVFLNNRLNQLYAFFKNPTLLTSSGMIPRLGSHLDKEVILLMEKHNREYLLEQSKKSLVQAILAPQQSLPRPPPTIPSSQNLLPESDSNESVDELGYFQTSLFFFHPNFLTPFPTTPLFSWSN